MAQNYAKGKPMGNNGTVLNDCPPPVRALVTTLRDTGLSASSILILSQDTTAIEVSATAAPAFIKWMSQATVDSSVAGTSVITTGATANFDHVIAAATVRRFVVPVAIAAPSGQTSSQMGANVANGLYTHIAYRGTGAVTSLISVTEYGSSNG